MDHGAELGRGVAEATYYAETAGRGDCTGERGGGCVSHARQEDRVFDS